MTPGMPRRPSLETAGFTGDQPPLIDTKVVHQLRRQVADRLSLVRRQRQVAGEPDPSAAEDRRLTLALIREEVAAYVRALVAAGDEPPDAQVDVQLRDAIAAAMFGAGPLDRLLKDPDVENIDINRFDEVFVSYAGGRRERVGPIADSDEELIRIISTLGAYAGVNARPFGTANPQLDLRLPDGSRLSAVMGATQYPSLSVRRNRLEGEIFLHSPLSGGRGRRASRARAGGSGALGRAPTMVDLGTVDEQTAAFLAAAVRGRCNIVVAGATDGGKTTLLRALINCIPPVERLITVEVALELGLRRHPDLHPDVVEMEVLLPGPDGAGGLDIEDLVRRTRRMNPSRVIVGEVLGPETMDMLLAMSGGNDGSLSTIHARTAAHVLELLSMHVTRKKEFDRLGATMLIASAVDLVVFIRKNPHRNGRREVMEILEITGTSDANITRSRIFREGSDGRARRDHPVAIMRAPLLAEHGYHDGDWEDYVPSLSPVADPVAVSRPVDPAREPGPDPFTLPDGSEHWAPAPGPATWGA